MGLLNKIFGDSAEIKEEYVLPWITLNNLKASRQIALAYTF